MNRLLLLGMCVGMLLVGCSDGDNTTASDESAEPSTETVVTPAAAAPEVETPVTETDVDTRLPQEADLVVETEPVVEAHPEGVVVEVASMQAFLDALGPNRTLQLAGNVEYRLEAAERGVSDYYQWREVADGQYQLIVRNCDGLTIQGPVNEPAYIVTEHPYATVLQFDNCSELTLANLEIGHDPTPGFCIGAVVGLTDCADVSISDCVLFGSGTEGLRMENVAALTVSRSVITECTSRILTANSSRELTFIDCQFVDNKQYGGFNLTDTVGVRLTDCAIERNLVSEYGGGLFRINLTVDEARVVIEGGRIEENDAPLLCDPAGMVTHTDVSIVNNSWQPSEN